MTSKKGRVKLKEKFDTPHKNEESFNLSFVKKSLLTSCRRVGLSKKKSNNKPLDIPDPDLKDEIIDNTSSDSIELLSPFKASTSKNQPIPSTPPDEKPKSSTSRRKKSSHPHKRDISESNNSESEIVTLRIVSPVSKKRKLDLIDIFNPDKIIKSDNNSSATVNKKVLTNNDSDKNKNKGTNSLTVSLPLNISKNILNLSKKVLKDELNNSDPPKKDNIPLKIDSAPKNLPKEIQISTPSKILKSEDKPLKKRKLKLNEKEESPLIPIEQVNPDIIKTSDKKPTEMTELPKFNKKRKRPKLVKEIIDNVSNEKNQNSIVPISDDIKMSNVRTEMVESLPKLDKKRKGVKNVKRRTPKIKLVDDDSSNSEIEIQVSKNRKKENDKKVKVNNRRSRKKSESNNIELLSDHKVFIDNKYMVSENKSKQQNVITVDKNSLSNSCNLNQESSYYVENILKTEGVKSNEHHIENQNNTKRNYQGKEIKKQIIEIPIKSNEIQDKVENTSTSPEIPEKISDTSRELPGNPIELSGNPKEHSGNSQELSEIFQKPRRLPELTGNPQKFSGNPQELSENPQDSVIPQELSGKPQKLGGISQELSDISQEIVPHIRNKAEKKIYTDVIFTPPRNKDIKSPSPPKTKEKTKMDFDQLSEESYESSHYSPPAYSPIESRVSEIIINTQPSEEIEEISISCLPPGNNECISSFVETTNDEKSIQIPVESSVENPIGTQETPMEISKKIPMDNPIDAEELEKSRDITEKSQNTEMRNVEKLAKSPKRSKNLNKLSPLEIPIEFLEKNPKEIPLKSPMATPDVEKSTTEEIKNISFSETTKVEKPSTPTKSPRGAKSRKNLLSERTSIETSMETPLEDLIESEEIEKPKDITENVKNTRRSSETIKFKTQKNSRSTTKGRKSLLTSLNLMENPMETPIDNPIESQVVEEAIDNIEDLKNVSKPSETTKIKSPKAARGANLTRKNLLIRLSPIENPMETQEVEILKTNTSTTEETLKIEKSPRAVRNIKNRKSILTTSPMEIPMETPEVENLIDQTEEKILTTKETPKVEKSPKTGRSGERRKNPLTRRGRKVSKTKAINIKADLDKNERVSEELKSPEKDDSIEISISDEINSEGTIRVKTRKRPLSRLSRRSTKKDSLDIKSDLSKNELTSEELNPKEKEESEKIVEDISEGTVSEETVLEENRIRPPSRKGRKIVKKEATGIEVDLSNNAKLGKELDLKNETKESSISDDTNLEEARKSLNKRLRSAKGTKTTTIEADFNKNKEFKKKSNPISDEISDKTILVETTPEYKEIPERTIPEEIPKVIPDEISEITPNNIPKKIPDDIPEIKTIKISKRGRPKKMPEESSEGVSVVIPESIPETISDRISKRRKSISRTKPEEISERIEKTEVFPTEISDEITHIIHKRIPDRISEVIPENPGRIPDRTIEKITKRNTKKVPNRISDGSSEITDEIQEGIPKDPILDEISEEKMPDRKNLSTPDSKLKRKQKTELLNYYPRVLINMDEIDNYYKQLEQQKLDAFDLKTQIHLKSNKKPQRKSTEKDKSKPNENQTPRKSKLIRKRRRTTTPFGLKRKKRKKEDILLEPVEILDKPIIEKAKFDTDNESIGRIESVFFTPPSSRSENDSDSNRNDFQVESEIILDNPFGEGTSMNCITPITSKVTGSTTSRYIETLEDREVASLSSKTTTARSESRVSGLSIANTSSLDIDSNESRSVSRAPIEPCQGFKTYCLNENSSVTVVQRGQCIEYLKWNNSAKRKSLRSIYSKSSILNRCVYSKTEPEKITSMFDEVLDSEPSSSKSSDILTDNSLLPKPIDILKQVKEAESRIKSKKSILERLNKCDSLIKSTTELRKRAQGALLEFAAFLRQRSGTPFNMELLLYNMSIPHSVVGYNADDDDFI